MSALRERLPRYTSGRHSPSPPLPPPLDHSKLSRVEQFDEEQFALDNFLLRWNCERLVTALISLGGLKYRLAVELNTTSALANYATEAGLLETSPLDHYQLLNAINRIGKILVVSDACVGIMFPERRKSSSCSARYLFKDSGSSEVPNSICEVDCTHSIASECDMDTLLAAISFSPQPCRTTMPLVRGGS
uniref:Uncharacterized protein n=1 Tax=Timema shepardi TaxID=629360 RepID=A0A7R9AYT6_TIMSH|nr:unnamed protein product [Timema shepardi]